jgi:hypothetical protein
MRKAWEQYSGYPFYMFLPIGKDATPLKSRMQHWAVEGLRKLASFRSSDGKSKQALTSGEQDTLSALRKGFYHADT